MCRLTDHDPLVGKKARDRDDAADLDPGGVQLLRRLAPRPGARTQRIQGELQETEADRARPRHQLDRRGRPARRRLMSAGNPS